jgi:hypothetical protein
VVSRFKINKYRLLFLAIETEMFKLFVTGPMRMSYGPPLVGEVPLISHFTQLARPRRWRVHRNYEEGKCYLFRAMTEPFHPVRTTLASGTLIPTAQQQNSRSPGICLLPPLGFSLFSSRINPGWYVKLTTFAFHHHFVPQATANVTFSSTNRAGNSCFRT